MLEFEAWPKIPRWANEVMTITEKIDGTNACISIDPEDPDRVFAQSRKRFIEPGDDNFGFARWVQDHAGILTDVLGPGRHYGEWYGSGIQRGYGLTNGERRFALFNVYRWHPEFQPENHAEILRVDNLEVVPVLYTGKAADGEVENSLQLLREKGSFAQEGFDNPEGVIVHYKLTQKSYKAFVHDDGIPKSLKEGN